MFKEQLEEIRKTRKTLLHRGRSIVRFVEDEAVDTHTLLAMIKHKNPYTNMRALLFERHRLSEKENLVFNAKFSAFLKGLAGQMNDPSIDLLLEFLVRIYHVDTYNTHELLFLIMPFKRYVPQIRILSQNISGFLAGMREYSIRTISKAILEDLKLTRSFVDYFKHYDALSGFLDSTLDEMVGILRGSNYDCLSEMHQIFAHLISLGHQKKALELYHRLCEYLDSDEFVELLLPYYTEDAIRQVVPHVECGPVYEDALCNGTGRRFLLDDQQLLKYLQFCEAKNVAPKEFNGDEYRLLRAVYLNIYMGAEPLNVSNVVAMYAAAASKIGMTRILAGNASVTVLLEHMNDEDMAYFVGNSNSLHMQLLNDRNHVFILRNMKTSVFRANYREILTACLEFISFDATLFDTFIMVFPASEVAKCNIIKLAIHHNCCLVRELLPFSSDSIFLSYLLKARYDYDIPTTTQLIEDVRLLQQPKLVSEACVLLGGCVPMELAKDFCVWAIDNGHCEAALPFIERNASLLDSMQLITVVRKTSSSRAIQALLERRSGLVETAYDECRHDILLQIARLSSVESILIRHPDVFSFLTANFGSLPGQRAIVAFAVDNILMKDALQCVLGGYSHLITLRTHHLWAVIKVVIMENNQDCAMVKQFLGYIIENINKFVDDGDLFAWLFAGGARLSAEQLEEVAGVDSMSAAELINEGVKGRAAEVLPVIPLVLPLLITHRKESVRMLFEDFGDMLYAYAGSILSDYPGQIGVLTRLSPRYSLGEIVTYLEKALPSVSEERLEGLVCIVREILSKGRCQSGVALQKVALFLQSETAQGRIPEDIYKLFIRFYIRSRGRCSDSAVEELLLRLSVERPALFLESARECMESNTDIFQAVYAHAVQCIMSGNGQLMGFAAAFLGHRPEFAKCGCLPLCRKTYELEDSNSAVLLAALCCADGSLVPEVSSFIRLAIAEDRGVVHGLATLAFLFRRVPTFRAHKAAIQPLSAMLSENADEAVAESARILHESLQLLQ